MRRLFISTVLVSSILIAGCGASRKLSKVGLRELSSDELAEASDRISQLRATVQNLDKIPRACSSEIRSEFVSLSSAKVALLGCPQGFVEVTQVASPLLKLEERALLEEMANAQCRGVAESQREIELRSFADSFERDGPIGRRKAQEPESLDEDINTLTALHDSIDEILAKNLRLERWVRVQNGPYILSEGDLPFFYDLIVRGKCEVKDNTVEQGYNAMEALEDLRQVLPAGESKQSLEKFLRGIHKLLDKKVGEYFR